MRISVTLGLIISKTISMFTSVKGKAFIMSRRPFLHRTSFDEIVANNVLKKE